MAWNYVNEPQWRRWRSDSNDGVGTTNDDQTPAVSRNDATFLKKQQDKQEALLHQTESLCAADKRRTDAVRRRLGLQPHPPPVPRQTPSTAAPRWRRSPVLPDWAEEVELRSEESSRSSSCSSVDTHTPEELWTNHLLRSPSPPAAPPCRTKPSRLPQMWMYLKKETKEVKGCRLQTVQKQMDDFQKRFDTWQQSSVSRVPASPASSLLKTPPTPTPPKTPATTNRQRTRHGTTLRPAKLQVTRCPETREPAAVQNDGEQLEELPPLSNPSEKAFLCLEQLRSRDWAKTMEALKWIQALAQHHPHLLSRTIHDVWLAVTEVITSLRSTLACAAMDTAAYLHVYLRNDMNYHAEHTGRALLLKAAQSNGNIFVQQHANRILALLVRISSPEQILTTLCNNGLNHLCAAVRSCSAQQFHLLADRMGPDAIMTASFTKRFLDALCKLCLDASQDVRHHGHTVLEDLSPHKDFSKLWNTVVAEKDRLPLERVLRNRRKE